jgi:hypothetical protein
MKNKCNPWSEYFPSSFALFVKIVGNHSDEFCLDRNQQVCMDYEFDLHNL